MAAAHVGTRTSDRTCACCLIPTTIVVAAQSVRCAREESRASNVAAIALSAAGSSSRAQKKWCGRDTDVTCGGRPGQVSALSGFRSVGAQIEKLSALNNGRFRCGVVRPSAGMASTPPPSPLPRCSCPHATVCAGAYGRSDPIGRRLRKFRTVESAPLLVSRLSSCLACARPMFVCCRLKVLKPSGASVCCIRAVCVLVLVAEMSVSGLSEDWSL